MIVKFLKSSKTFAAVSYNEKRVNNGEAELLAKENFGNSISLFDDVSICREYLKLWSNKNSRIKNPQLHVVFSAKHDSFDKHRLKDIAVQWLKEMGYGDVPYLIYFHHNSNHNHVHVITTRVDKDGFKINDSFEHERGLRVLNKLMNIDELKNLRTNIANLLHYSFNTRTQFMELCAHSGMRNYESKDKQSVIIEWGSSKIKIGYGVIDFCSNRYYRDIDKKRRSQIQAFIYKYAKIFNRDEFCYFMKLQFGLDFIFYGKNNTINGYTIIDYSNKSVYKGSSVLSAKFLNELFKDSEDRAINPVEILENYIGVNKYHNQLMAESYLKRFGITIEGDKIVDMYGVSADIPESILRHWQQLSYVDYLSKVYKVHSPKDLKFLSSLLNVDYELLKHSKIQDNSNYIDYYKSILNDSLTVEGKFDYTMLQQNGIRLMSFENKTYLVDDIHNSVISLSEVINMSDISVEYESINRDFITPVENGGGVGLDMSLLNFDTNIGSSSGKGKRKKR
ncbi:MAG: relaxase/mobilization nuclease domain-containing protein [Lachnospiraceae bacterium]|nr:relaxase/mobilization nuclease domain-containing protein [Lachnospiraceae bacterium]